MTWVSTELKQILFCCYIFKKKDLFIVDSSHHRGFTLIVKYNMNASECNLVVNLNVVKHYHSN